MAQYLILELSGMMQAWGDHTYEDYRPSHNFPTRSAIEGLLAACLGLDRADLVAQAQLAHDLQHYAVQAVKQPQVRKKFRKLEDFHTVSDARQVDGKPRKFPVVSRREYLYDAHFLAALAFREDSTYSLEQLRAALQKPYYTPFLGRRACPLTRPLFKAIVEAEDLHQALAQAVKQAALKTGGPMYSELPQPETLENRVYVRDRRDYSQARRSFDKREMYIHPQEAAHVSE